MNVHLQKLATPSRFASHPFSPLPSSGGLPTDDNKPPRHSGTPPLKRRGIFSLSALLLFCFFSLLLSPFSAWAGDWSGIRTYTKDEVINEDINLTGSLIINIADGKTVTINGVISGPANCHLQLSKTAAGTTGGTLIFNKANTYQGETRIGNGVLKLGTNGEIEKSSNVVLYNDAKLEIVQYSKRIKNLNSTSTASEVKCNAFDLRIGTTDTSNDGGGTFAGKISGTGRIHKEGTQKFTLTGENTYKGATFINAGTLKLEGNGSIATSSGVILYGSKLEIAGGGNSPKTIKNLNSNVSTSEVILGETLRIGTSETSDDASGTFAGKISGTGAMALFKYGKNALTLSGNNTFEGQICVFGGTLKLGVGGSIEQVRSLTLQLDGTKFEISENKTIQCLMGNTSNTEVALGSSTLTIKGTSVNNNGGFMAGKFTGTGGVINKSSNYSLSNNNEATGTFKVENGTVRFDAGSPNGKWAGNVEQNAGTKLKITGTATIDKVLYLKGGEIDMDLTGANPSKIVVGGACSATGVTTLNVTPGNVTDYELIKATSGLDDINKFSLNTPAGYYTKLTIKNNTLLLTASTTDFTAPVPENGGTITCSSTATSATLKWTAATDDVTPSSKLRYFVYRSTKNDISNPAECAAKGKLLNSGGTVGITTYNDKGLSSGTSYYYNVVVADEANNKAAYNAVKTTTKVGIDPITNDELRITVYPNPTNGEFKVQSSKFKVQSVEVFDVMGKKFPFVIPNAVRNPEQYGPKPDGVVIDISHLSAGIYFLKIQTETGIVTKKIIKQ